ncbi:MAG: PQQ-binding-like beta-propeller repeat protein [Planctomycetota bacterium]
MLRTLLTFAFLLFGVFLTGVDVSDADDWPAFLGPGGMARSSDVVPTQWSEQSNLAWKVKLPGTGSSSPVITGDQVIVTCYVGGTNASRQVISFDKRTGEERWSVDFPIDYSEDRFEGFITEHGYASNTPVTDGTNVYVFLGKGGVHSIRLDGKTNWSVDVGKGSSNRRWGSAASLVQFEDLIIVNASEESRSIVALNRETGEEVWKQNADMLELTYGTPRVVNAQSASPELVISVPSEIWSLNPRTGKLKWYADSPMTGNVSPSVVVDNQIIYSFGGFRASGSIAVRVGGKKDVSYSNVVWTSRSSSYVATPLLVDGRFYWIDDRGIAYCTSAEDGELIYRERVDDLSSGRPVYASPVLIGGYIYVPTRRSGTIVYRPTTDYSEIARNRLSSDASDFNASPAVCDGRLYLRSDEALYCIAKAP